MDKRKTKLSRRCLFLLVTVFLGLSSTSAQERPTGTVQLPKEVTDYLDLTQSRQTLGELSTMPLSDLKHIARIAYEASSTDPVAFEMESQKRKWAISPNLFNLRLNQTIRERISQLDFVLIGVPYLFAGKILKLDTHSYKLSDKVSGLNLRTPITYVTVRVEDVIKGTKRFSLGDTCTFYYFSAWRPTSWNFQAGETDLFPLSPCDPTPSNGQDSLYLDWALDKRGPLLDNFPDPNDTNDSYGRYPIVNNR